MSQTQNWKATGKQLETFIDQTSLIPVIVLDDIAGELAIFLKDDSQAETMYETLRNKETASYIEGRSALVFENNASFRTALMASDPRPFYYGFVRHWVAGVVKVKFPALFSKLPSSFAMGAPIPPPVDMPAFYALFRGHDCQGVMQQAWRRLHENALTIEGAKEECAGLFGSGLLWHPLAAEFRVIAEDGTPLADAQPPHKEALQWGTPDISMTEFLNVFGNPSFSLPPLAFGVGHVVASNG